MSHLALYLFGGFCTELDGQPLDDFGTDKNRLLLAYLALKCGRFHRREALASLLWPNRGEAAARNSLRQALYQLQRLLEPGSETVPHLLITTEQVQFNPASDHWVDVLEFETRLSACRAHHPAGLSLCAGCLDSLQRIIALYQGELLDGLTLPSCTQFTDWQILTQEVCHNQALAALSQLADYFEACHAYDQLIACTHRKIELEPWRESAYRRQIWALAKSGQRERALQQYEALREVLHRELGIPPTDQTRQLYEQIRRGAFFNTTTLIAGFEQPFTPANQSLENAAGTCFVERQLELAQLQGFLSASLAGHGRVAFIRGEAGSGKTALQHEFARRAMHAHGDLLVAGGACRAYAGLGDPCQPFREILETLAGISRSLRPGAVLSMEHARRLDAALPAVLQTLLDAGPRLIGSLLPTQELLQHARQTNTVDARMLARLASRAAQPDSVGAAAVHPDSQVEHSPSETSFLGQMGLFDQLARLLLALSRRFPLLILLDNLQWLDRASASLLFHLGGCLAGGRIFLLGAYRPEDIASPGEQKRHPIVAILNEFQRCFGEMQVDLSRADGRAFVNAYLDSQPNHFDEHFRATLYRLTGGNALFTVELLHAQKARGEVLQDQNGYWVPGSQMNWEQLPARVEAVIAERLGRLDRKCLTLLDAASVQGEIFFVAVLAQVLGVSEAEITARLSGPLSRQHHLVCSLDLAWPEDPQPASYRFCHLLYQKYLYQGLDDVQRARLHQATAEALERLSVTR
jgi:DNA-binding SARP family transcriptional activator